ncbi:MAG: hypothetical protein RLZZ62_1384, partial [Actinomycetota bacterium]
PATGRTKLGGRASAAMPGIGQTARPTQAEAKPESQPETKPKASEPLKPTAVLGDAEIKSVWSEVVASQKPIVRALYSAVTVNDCKDGVLTLGAPSEMHITKSNEHVQTLVESLQRIAGKKLEIKFHQNKMTMTQSKMFLRQPKRRRAKFLHQSMSSPRRFPVQKLSMTRSS